MIHTALQMPDQPRARALSLGAGVQLVRNVATSRRRKGGAE